MDLYSFFNCPGPGSLVCKERCHGTTVIGSDALIGNSQIEERGDPRSLCVAYLTAPAAARRISCKFCDIPVDVEKREVYRRIYGAAKV
jgi:hypothetical protein